MLLANRESEIIAPSRHMRDRAADPYPERKGAHHEAPFLCLPVLWRVACRPFGAPLSGRSATSRHPPPSQRWRPIEACHMPKPLNDLTADQVRSLFNYDALTGDFSWKTLPRNSKSKKLIVGIKESLGYLRVKILGKKYTLHRVIWLWVYGSWPDEEVDHVNGIRDDNRLDNLRQSNRTMNNQNRHYAHSNNKLGLMGVYWNKQSSLYRASIQVNNHKIHLGSFRDPHQAHEAYLDAKRQIHAGCTL